MIDMIFQKHICKDQAELVGMMFGDGNMYNKYNYTYSIRITLNSKKDLDYSEYIIHLFQKLFSINPKIKIIDKKSELSIYLYSKKLIEYFHFELKIPFSPKILSAIPEYIKSDKILLSSFIRELFDTDGCVYIQSDKKYRYYLVKITTKHRLFAIDLKYALNSLGLKSFICVKKGLKGNTGYDVVCRKTERFFDMIGSNNDRNLKKWGCRDSNFRNNTLACYFP